MGGTVTASKHQPANPDARGKPSGKERLALLPCFQLLSHRLEVALHSIHANRDAVAGSPVFLACWAVPADRSF